MLYRRLLSSSLSLLTVLAGAGFAFSAPAADFVHVIVLNNGHQVEVKTMPEVKGNFAYFATLSGQLFYTRASNIDQQKTQERNAERERASIIAAEIRTDTEMPSNSSLGALAESEKRRRGAMAPSRVVTARDLERANKVELNSVERLPGAPLPDNKSDAGNDREGSQPVTSTQRAPDGSYTTNTTVTVPITTTLQPQPPTETPSPSSPNDQ